MIDLNKLDLARASSILYHATSVSNVLSIVTSRSFKLAATAGTQAEMAISDGYPFYMSCTRSKIGEYSVKASYGAVLVLNGDWFSHNRRVKPVDYWGPGWGKDEMEDRIMSYDAEIKLPADMTKVIRSAHILLEESEDNKVYLGLLRRCLLALHVAKIPSYVYVNKKAYLAQNTRKALPLAKFIDKLKNTEDYQPFSTRYKRLQVLNVYIAMLHKKKWAELTEEEQYWAKRVIYSYGLDDPTRSVMNDIHGEKTSDAGRKFATELRKRKMSVRDFVKAMQDKWAPLINQHYEEKDAIARKKREAQEGK
jgi:hypothetical protein